MISAYYKAIQCRRCKAKRLVKKDSYCARRNECCRCANIDAEWMLD